jgi:hypothetical protein
MNRQSSRRLSKFLRGWLRTDAAIYCRQTSNNRTRFQERTILSLTILDPNTALIVVDLQKGIVAFVHPIADVISRTRALIDAFRRQELPVVLVNVAGRAPGRTKQPPRLQTLPEGWADLIPELDRQPGDIVVTNQAELGRLCEHGPGGTIEGQRRDPGCHHGGGDWHRCRVHRAAGL